MGYFKRYDVTDNQDHELTSLSDEINYAKMCRSSTIKIEVTTVFSCGSDWILFYCGLFGQLP
jgi:hypothetical protein